LCHAVCIWGLALLAGEITGRDWIPKKKIKKKKKAELSKGNAQRLK